MVEEYLELISALSNRLDELSKMYGVNHPRSRIIAKEIDELYATVYEITHPCWSGKAGDFNLKYHLYAGPLLFSPSLNASDDSLTVE